MIPMKAPIPQGPRAAKLAIEVLQGGRARFEITTGRIAGLSFSNGAEFMAEALPWDKDDFSFNTDPRVDDHLDAAILPYGGYSRNRVAPLSRSTAKPTISSSIRSITMSRRKNMTEGMQHEEMFTTLAKRLFAAQNLRRRTVSPVPELAGALRPVGLELVRAIGADTKTIERIQRDSVQRSEAWRAYVKEQQAKNTGAPFPPMRRKHWKLPPSPRAEYISPALVTGILAHVQPEGTPDQSEVDWFSPATNSLTVVASGNGSSGANAEAKLVYFGFNFTPPESTEYECLGFMNLYGAYAVYADDGWPDSKHASVEIACGIITGDPLEGPLVGIADVPGIPTEASQPILSRGGDNIEVYGVVEEGPNPYVAGPLAAGKEVSIVAFAVVYAYARGAGSFAEITLPSISCPLLIIRPQT
jgi:hypothetical protein